VVFEATAIEGPPATIRVHPSVNPIARGRDVIVSAEVFDAGDNPLSGHEFTWELSSDSLATIQPAAHGVLMTTRFTGDVTVTARTAGRAGTAQITIAPPNLHAPALEEIILCNPFPFTVAQPAPGDPSRIWEFDCYVRTMAELGLPPLANFVVRTSGVGMWDPEARRTELQGAAVDALTDACSWLVPFDPSPAPPLPGSYDRGTHSLQHQDLTNRLLDAPYRWLGTREAWAGDWTKATLLALARDRSMLSYVNHNSNTFDAKTLASVALNALLAIDDFPGLTPGEHAEIVEYLSSLVNKINFLTAQAGGRSADYLYNVDVQNHAWLKNSLVMQWGALTGNDRLFQQGVAQYVSVLGGQVRADGSIFNEASRGNVSLRATAYSIGDLIQIAETAALQGYDLYGMTLNGLNIHRMVEFFVDSMEDPGRIRPYAELQLNCEPDQCAGWANQDLGSVAANDQWNYAAWSEVYVRRFPASPLTSRLLALYPRGTVKRMVNNMWGTNGTCQARAI
jgi:poly(beta-D-mannuronate) lyase